MGPGARGEWFRLEGHDRGVSTHEEGTTRMTELDDAIAIIAPTNAGIVHNQDDGTWMTEWVMRQVLVYPRLRELLEEAGRIRLTSTVELEFTLTPGRVSAPRERNQVFVWVASTSGEEGT